MKFLQSFTEALYGRTIMASYHGLWSLAGFSGAFLGGFFISLGWAPWQHFLVTMSLAFLIIGLFSSRLLLKDAFADSNQPIFAKPDRSLIKLGFIAFCSMMCEGSGFMLVGAGVSSIVPLVYSAAGRSKVLSPGVAIAAVSTFGYMGFLFGPPFIGFVAHRFDLRVSLGLVAILGLVITALVAKIKGNR
jgi:hypothetical protein